MSTRTALADFILQYNGMMTPAQMQEALGVSRGVIAGQRRRLGLNMARIDGVAKGPSPSAAAPNAPNARLRASVEAFLASRRIPKRPPVVVRHAVEAARHEMRRDIMSISCVCGRPGAPIICDKHAALFRRAPS